MAPHGGQGPPDVEAASSAEIAPGALAQGLGWRRFRHPSSPMPITERLVLRSWRPSDRAPFARLNADPDVVEFLNDGVPFTRAQSDELFDAIQLHWEQRGFGLWCAAAREDPDECLGFVGLAVPSFLPSVLPAVEVGWRLARPAWGRGLATEGARASLRHAFEELELEAVISIIDPDNARSIRVAEKLGMRRGGAHVHPRTRRRLLAYEISSQDAAFSPRPA
jgi:RimJ/RimL family protein N-acetyltransferase